jgi:hypothetical protein
MPGIRPARGAPLRRSARAADIAGMDVTAAVSLQIQALALGNARASIERVQADAVPAAAPAAQPADAILQLSAAAQSLLTA